jgi:type IV pilus assembly protein PilZ
MNSTQPARLSSATSVARPSVVQLAIKEKSALYAAYIPLFTEGGMFIPTARDYKLGDDVYVLITPPKAAGNRTQGVGVRFPSDEKSRLLKIKIEEILGAHLASDRPTQTI